MEPDPTPAPLGRPLPPRPPPWQRWQQRLARRWQRLHDRRAERAAWPQWCLLVGRGLDPARAAPALAQLRPILPPADRFWADPFLCWQDGELHIFCEEYLRGSRHGRISLLRLDADLQPRGPSQPVLSEDRHLSYPFLFRWQGQLYMVPETARSGTIDLYRCTAFPLGWVREYSLIGGLEAADATLFEHAGRWWLFCAVRDRRGHINEALHAFHADSPISRHWTPHAANPIVRDFARGRPGGSVWRDPAGRLLRPGQDCVPRYGQGLGLYLIDHLSPWQYRECRLWQLPAAGPWRALHHLDCEGEWLVMDAQRLLPTATGH